MFTGIIDHCGTISRIEKQANTMVLWIDCDYTDMQEGESICVNGICLTVTEPKPRQFRCDISPETLSVTTANHFMVDNFVNLERSLRPIDRMGGHFVMGHVDRVCYVSKLIEHAEFTEMHFAGLEKSDREYLAKKGSVSVNGVSLTINEVTPDSFHVMLIPHTLERTNLQYLRENDKVNIEFDYIARVVVNQLHVSYKSRQL